MNHLSQKHHLVGCLISPEDTTEIYGDEIDVEQTTIELYVKKIRTVLALASTVDISNIKPEDRSVLYPLLEKMRGEILYIGMIFIHPYPS